VSFYLRCGGTGVTHNKLNDAELDAAIKAMFKSIADSGIKDNGGPLYNELKCWPELRALLDERAMRYMRRRGQVN
jgi:hypothetical protein